MGLHTAIGGIDFRLCTVYISVLVLYLSLFIHVANSLVTMLIRENHSTFSLVDMQDMDATVSSFNALETVEAGPLLLAWAVFLCLMLSLPEKEDCNPLMVCR